MTNDPFQLLIAAIASVRAEAEANPAFTYATGYLPYAYGAPLAYAHAPLVYTAAAGCQNEAGAVVPCAHGGVVPFGVVPAAVAPAAADGRTAASASASPRLRERRSSRPHTK